MPHYVFFLSQRRSQDVRVSHLDILSVETLGPVTTVKAHTLIRVVGIVIVPIHQRAGVPEASCRAYIAAAPTTSTSRRRWAISLLPIMLIKQQALIP
jgi:hypothetical protein